MMSRKTYTSPEVKDRWNRAHYEQVQLRVAKGGRETVQQLALAAGMSTAAYLRHLIISDAKSRGFGDISAKIGGGGLAEYATVEAIMNQARTLNRRRARG